MPCGERYDSGERVVGEELAVIFVALAWIVIGSKTLVGSVVVFVHRAACPPMTLDAKVVVAACG